MRRTDHVDDLPDPLPVDERGYGHAIVADLRKRGRPIISPDCECSLIWTGERTALCACNGDAYDQARAER